MTDPLIPAATRLAARRGFIRTFYQALASAIPTTAIALGTTREWWAGVALGVGGAVVSALLAGLASYWSICARGIPDDYQTATRAADSVAPAAVQLAAVQQAARTVAER